MKNLLLLLVALGAFCTSIQTFASHIDGASITYKQLGPNFYEVSLVLNRNCSGIVMPNTETVTITSPCSPTISLPVSLINPGGNQVTSLCQSQVPNSTCNGGTLPGEEIYIYRGQVTLAPNCTDWNLSWKICCRSTGLVTNVGGGAFLYVETTLNKTSLRGNSSPVFAELATPYLCNGVAAAMSFGVTDADCDSLVYSIICPKTGPGQSVLFNAPYTCQQPISGMTINSRTGLLYFVPVTNGLFAVALQVDEYDRCSGEFLGSVSKEMRIFISTCTNLPPYSSPALTNLNTNTTQTSPYNLSVCGGDTVCFDITFTDPDLGDTINIISNLDSIYPGATIMQVGANPATANVCFKTPRSYNSCAPLSFTAKDDNCPAPGIWMQQIIVTTHATSAQRDQSICAGDSAELCAMGGTIFNWTALSGTPISVPSNFSCNPCTSPVVSPTVTTLYQVSSNMGGGCPAVDTVTIQVGPIFSYSLFQSDTVVCLGDTVLFGVQTTPTGYYQYAWSPPFDVSNVYDSVTFVTPSAAGQHTYYVSATNNYGCAKYDSIVIIVQDLPVAFTGLGWSNCIGTPSQIGNNGLLQNGYNYSWNNGAGSGVVVAGNATTVVNPLVTTNYILTISDTSGVCPDDSDTLVITVIPAPLADAGADTSICPGDSVVLGGTMNGMDGYIYWWSHSGGGIVNSGLAPGVVHPSTTISYSLTVRDTLWTCAPAIDIVTVTVLDSTAVPCVVGIPEHSAEKALQDVKIVPNPNDGNFAIYREGNLVGDKLQFEIRDFLGRLVHQGVIPKGLRDVPVDISKLPQGTYLLRIAIGTTATSRQILKF